MSIPHALQTGLIVGRFGVGIADGPDIDGEPDIVPASGKITFTAMIPYTQNPDSLPAPLTVLRAPITALLDDEGYLCTPDPANPGMAGARGIRLFATDDPGASVTGWTYRVEYDFNRVGITKPLIEMHNISVPSGGTGDLAKMAPVPSSQGYGIPQAEAAALRAEAAAQVALDVQARADAGEFDGAQGPAGNATVRIDASVGTRVFITDGTTEKVVSGDTGWRDVSGDFATFGNDPKLTATTIKVRRKDDTVHLEVVITSSDNLFPGSTKLMNNLVSGFRFSGNYDWAAGYYSSAALVIGTLSTGSYIQGRAVPPNTALPAGMRLKASWLTNDPWPTILPGVAI